MSGEVITLPSGIVLEVPDGPAPLDQRRWAAVLRHAQASITEGFCPNYAHPLEWRPKIAPVPVTGLCLQCPDAGWHHACNDGTTWVRYGCEHTASPCDRCRRDLFGGQP